MGQIKRIVLERELDERLRWIIFLRWFAGAGVSLVIWMSHFFLDMHLPLFPLIAGNLLLFCYNYLFSICNRRLIALRGREVWFKQARGFANIQIATDLLMLGYFLHFSGGIENPFVFYFVFHMVISSILLSNRAAYAQATFAVCILSAVAILETTGHLPHYHPDGFIAPYACLLNARFTAGMLLILGSTFYIIVYLTTSITNKLRKGERSLLIATERLAHSDKLKSLYVRKVSHDIQSSLSTIQTCVTVVLNGTTGPITDKSRDMLRRAESRSAALIRFVKDLLHLSSIRAHGTAEKTPLSLTDTIHQVVENTRMLAEKKRLRIDATIRENFFVKSIPHALEELLTNLIGNAIRYTPEAGTITIRVTRNRNNMIQTSVSDTGIGISPEDQPKIFQDFFRAKNAEIHTQNGTGLGLSIAKQIVESHGGTIWVKSVVDQGTTFSFSLPEAVLHADERMTETGTLKSKNQEF